MKRGTLTLVAAGIALAFAVPISVAFSEPAPPAQNAGPGMMHPGMSHPGGAEAFQHRCENAEAHRAAKLAYAEVKLQLTEAQKPAWIRFADAVKAASEPQARLCADLAGKPAPVALPDRLDRAERLASVRLAEIQAVRPALT